MLRELSREDFINTMEVGMTDVTGNAESVVDIWPYVSELVVKKSVSEYVFNKQLVEKVYRNSAKTFDQVLLPTENENIFIVIIIDMAKEIVYGHYKLDVADEYGL